jgi:hypothetical protein
VGVGDGKERGACPKIPSSSQPSSPLGDIFVYTVTRNQLHTLGRNVRKHKIENRKTTYWNDTAHVKILVCETLGVHPRRHFLTLQGSSDSLLCPSQSGVDAVDEQLIFLPCISVKVRLESRPASPIVTGGGGVVGAVRMVPRASNKTLVNGRTRKRC